MSTVITYLSVDSTWEILPILVPKCPQVSGTEEVSNSSSKQHFFHFKLETSTIALNDIISVDDLDHDIE